MAFYNSSTFFFLSSAHKLLTTTAITSFLSLDSFIKQQQQLFYSQPFCREVIHKLALFSFSFSSQATTHASCCCCFCCCGCCYCPFKAIRHSTRIYTLSTIAIAKFNYLISADIDACNTFVSGNSNLSSHGNSAARTNFNAGSTSSSIVAICQQPPKNSCRHIFFHVEEWN